MNPAISVLLPLFNAETYLRTCLESVFHQTFRDFEVVAVDDGSVDGTAAILADYARGDSRLRVFRRGHSGIVAALNHGLSLCRGEWVARMDGDDLMDPQRLALQWEFARANPDLDLIGCLVDLAAGDDPLRPGQLRYRDWANSLPSDRAIKLERFVELPIWHPTFFARRAFFEHLGGYTDPAWAEDYDFFLRAAESGARFGKVEACLLIKRDAPDRLCRTDARYKRQAMFRAKAHYLARGSWLEGRPQLLLAGTGPSARTAARALAGEKIQVDGFLDREHGARRTILMGRPVFPFGDLLAERLREGQDRVFVLICVSDRAGADRIEHFLDTAGLEVGREFLRFC